MKCSGYGVRTRCPKVYLVRYVDGHAEGVTVRRCIDTFPDYWKHIVVAEIDVRKIDWKAPHEIMEPKIEHPATN